MPELDVAAQDAALRMLFGGTLYVGVTRSKPVAGDAATDEEDDGGYQRRAITLSEPYTDEASGRRYVTNPEPVLFPEYRRSAERPVTHAFLSESPTGGVVKWADELAEPEQLRAGGILFFAAGKFRVGIKA
jgi:hypothetical protein